MKTASVLLVILLSGCGSFTLGYVHEQPKRTADQQRLDTLDCKDKAHMAADTAGRQVGSFFLGMTLIGVPVAFAMDRVKQREVFTECMQDQGYGVGAA